MSMMCTPNSDKSVSEIIFINFLNKNRVSNDYIYFDRSVDNLLAYTMSPTEFG